MKNGSLNVCGNEIKKGNWTINGNESLHSVTCSHCGGIYRLLHYALSGLNDRVKQLEDKNLSEKDFNEIFEKLKKALGLK